MIDPAIIIRLRAYVCCEPDSQPPSHNDLGALLAEVDRAATIAEERDSARRELIAIDNAICASGHPPGDGYNPLRLVRELLAKVPPTPTIPGPMPEPWPGMGATVEDSPNGYRKGQTVVFGGYYYDRAGKLILLAPNGVEIPADRITAIYDGRRRIWQRNP